MHTVVPATAATTWRTCMLLHVPLARCVWVLCVASFQLLLHAC